MTTPKPMIPPTPETLFPIFGECFSCPILQHWLHQQQLPKRLYWSVFTPLLTLWCLVLQRLKKDHTLDAEESLDANRPSERSAGVTAAPDDTTRRRRPRLTAS